MKSMLVLGGGQLGLMMAIHAAKLGLKIDRLDTDSRQLLPGASHRVRIDTTPEHLSTAYDVITAEIEHLPDTDFFAALYQSPTWANKRAFKLLPDRNQQKSLLDKLTVPTARWRSINRRQDLSDAGAALGEQLVVKTTRGGYDGRGQWILPHRQQPPAALYGRLIAEQRISFLREVSLIGVRSYKGECFFLPLAINVHREGILRFTVAGNTVDPILQRQAQALLTPIMEHLDYVGVMAMECFVTREGLLVNELAPRVHNSGHWSQLGAELDQFGLHVHALLDLPLPSRQHCHCRPTIMLNLIGCEFNPEWLRISGIHCHWYGKSLRRGRKLGHINIDASSNAQLAASTQRLLPLLDASHRAMLQQAIEYL